MQRSEDGLLFRERKFGPQLCVSAPVCWCVRAWERRARGQEPLNKGPHTWQGFSPRYLLSAAVAPYLGHLFPL